MALYACVWCNQIIREKHLAFVVGELRHRVHGCCCGRWLETERLLGRPVLGEPPFQPKNRGLR